MISPTLTSPPQTNTGSQYSPLTGLVYVFNLIVGTGALTLPKAFCDAGWGIGTAVLCVFAFMSFLTATFVLEVMACANAMIHWKRLKRLKTTRGAGYVSDELVNRCIVDQESESTNPRNVSEDAPLLESDGNPNLTVENICSYYEISEIVELGRMTSLFFSRTGRTLFYLCITIYLYGDLAIYAAAVAKSLRDVTCTFLPTNSTSHFNLPDTDPCRHESDTWTRKDAYRLALGCFIGIVGPFVFCNVQKTKYLQILTSLMRWLAFGAMVTMAVLRILRDETRPHPPIAKFQGLSNLLGVSVYSFMCHHSLPSLVTPISRKKRLSWLLAADYGLILSFYLLLTFTGIFAFAELNDLYTLNFPPIPGESLPSAVVHYFLALFPVFTLSTNFPIIAITLRNNLKSVFLKDGRMYSWCVRSCLFPILALIPPVGVAFVTNELEWLVGITGGYAGVGIQYVIPSCLIYFSRRTTTEVIGIGVKNPYSSVFKHTFWVAFVQLWAITCIIFVTWNNFF